LVLLEGVCGPLNGGGEVHPISSMLRVAVIVSLVALCAAHGGMKKKYADTKIYESCMGKEYIQGFYKEMKASSKKCSTQPQMFGIKDIDFQDVIDEVRNMALPWGSRREESNQYFQLVPRGSRSKRHAGEEKHTHTTAEKLYHMQEKMACMIGNMTCMLRDLDWMNEDKTPNFALYEKKINDIPGADKEGLKAELLWGLDCCKDFSMCVSPQKAKSPFLKELGTFISFSKCFEMKKMMACMKTEFKAYAAKDGYENVDELLDYGFGLMMGMSKNNPEKIGINAIEGAMNGDFLF